MSRLSFDQIARAPAPSARGWSPARYLAWTALLCAMVFWATLIILG
jgi:hypothetical protein